MPFDRESESLQRKTENSAGVVGCDDKRSVSVSLVKNRPNIELRGSVGYGVGGDQEEESIQEKTMRCFEQE